MCIVETKKDVLELEKLVFQLPVFATILDSEKRVFAEYWNNIWNAFFESTPKKLRLATCASTQEKLDFSDSISFLQAARKLWHRVLTPVPPNEVIDDLFCLPFHNTQVEELIAQLDKVLGHLDVNVSEIDAGWTRHIEGFECTKEGQSFDNTLRFICQLKRQAIAIKTCGQYGLMNVVTSADRTVSKLSTTASSQVARLDSSKPEDVVWCWSRVSTCDIVYKFTQICHTPSRYHWNDTVTLARVEVVSDSTANLLSNIKSLSSSSFAE